MPAIDDVTDAALLERFVRDGDEAAFATLVARLGPMVLGVVQRLVPDNDAAEDVFQAVFLVLVRKARTVRRRASLAGWLNKVAFRLALAARSRWQRRLRVEGHAVTMDPAVAAAETAWLELRPVLDEEVQRLPEKYRLPIILCYLEGKGQAETAAELGWPVGTVSGRLARARAMLRRRLTRRGVTLSAALLATLLTGHARAEVTPALVARAVETTQALVAGNGAAVSPQVAQLANDYFLRGLWAKLRAACGLLLLGLLALLPGWKLSGPSVQEALGDPAPGPRCDVVACNWPELSAPLAVPALSALPAPPPTHPPAAATKDPTASSTATKSVRPSIRIFSMQHFDAEETPAGERLCGMRPNAVRWSQRNRSRVTCAVFSADGQWLATGGRDGTVRLWQTTPLREWIVLRDIGGRCLELAIAPDNATLAIATLAAGTLEPSVRLWDLHAHPPRELPALVGMSRVAFAPDGRTLAALDAYGHLYLWHTDDPHRPQATVAGGFSSLVFGQGNLLAAGDLDGSVHVWRVRGSELGSAINAAAHLGKTSALAFSPDGQTLASGGDDGRIRCWRLSDDKLNLMTTLDAQSSVRHLNFPLCEALIATTQRGAAQRWKLNRNTFFKLAELSAPGTLAAGPDGKDLAVAYRSYRQSLPGTANDYPRALASTGSKLMPSFVTYLPLATKH